MRGVARCGRATYNRRVVSRTFCTPGPEATRSLGAALGEHLAAGTLVLLEGVFGAGKTTFAQGLAAGLGVRGRVSSPSFTLVRQHRGATGRPGFVHVDLYRLSQPAEVLDLALEDYLGGDDVIAIEWPDRAGSVAAPDVIEVSLHGLSAHRSVALSARGPLACAALDAMAVPEAVVET